MFNHKLVFLVLITIGLLASCGMSGNGDDEIVGDKHSSGFQINGPLDPDNPYPYFKLTEVFDGRGALEDFWDSVDGPIFNAHLDVIVDEHTDVFIESSLTNSRILGDESGLLSIILGTDVANILEYLTNSARNTQSSDQEIGRFYTLDAESYQQGFYSLLDEMYKKGENSGKMENVVINRKIVARILDKKTPEEIHDDMDELIEDLTGTDFDRDFKDLMGLSGKLLVRADYPMWVDSSDTPLAKGNIDPANTDHTNTGVGNTVKGVFEQVKWSNQILKDPNSRGWFHDLVNEIATIFNPDPASKNSDKTRTLMENIEKYFTKAGSIYGADSDNIYNTNNSLIYSDSELGNTIRELFPGQIQLLLRSDRVASLIGDLPGNEKKYVLRQMVDNLKTLQYDPDLQHIEQSINDLMKHDVWGRDRTVTDSGAWPASFLESLLFVTHVSTNLGWKDRDEISSDEVTLDTDPRYDHGHGAATESLSLNDSLFSIKTHKTLFSLGIYDISLAAADGNHIYRSKNSFNQENSGNYGFFFDQNYDVLHSIAGPCVGDLGVPDGGNPDGDTIPNNGFKAFSPDGKDENVMSAWTLGWISRACFNGEGPYYYADPNAETVVFDNREWKKYLRPDGKTYALVNDSGETTLYRYPAEGNDPVDEATTNLNDYRKNQRYNRFKAQWETDYYMSRYIRTINTGPDTTEDVAYYTTMTRDEEGRLQVDTKTVGQNPEAASLQYTELISESEPKRACSSPEEALFRNYQWLMTEKKMVIVLPMIVSFDESDEHNPDHTVFQVLEANGFSGLTNLRKQTGNHFWAKAGTEDSSDVPGDFRIEVASSGTSPPVDADSVYNDTLDCGHSTPAVIAHNIPALTRLGFPLSRTEKVRRESVTDMEVGSKEFIMGDETWEDRNAVLPPFISLVAAIYNNSPANRTSVQGGLRSFVEGTSALIKPLIYYQKDSGKHPQKTWKSRVRGGDKPESASTGWDDYVGEDFLRSTADFYNEANKRATSWDGTPEEKLYFQPAVEKTLFNILVDSDITAQAEAGDVAYSNTRMDGLLPVLTETKAITALLKILLSDANDSDLLYSSLEQINSAMKITKGIMTTINQGTTGEYGDVGSFKSVVYPEWMFATGTETGVYGEFTEFSGVRSDDIILDRGIDRLIGHEALDENNEGYGITAYVAEQNLEDWEDFYEKTDILEDMLHPDSPYSIVENILNMNDALFDRERSYQDIEIAGLLYAAGKIITRYNAADQTWVNQGDEGFDDLFTLFTTRLPVIHQLMADQDGYTGNNYHSTLVFNAQALKEGGLVEFMVESLATDENFETMFFDIITFINDPVVVEKAPLWSTLSDLLNDMATVLEITKDGEKLDEIYRDFGFQVN